MNRRLLSLTPLVLAILAPFGGSASSQTAGIDPEVDALMKGMCEHLASLKTFTIETEDTVEDVLPSGQKLQFSHRRTSLVHRPNKLRVESRGDLRNRTYWKKGKRLSVADHDDEVWAQVEVPTSIDDALDHLAERYDMSLPLADFFSADPYAIFSAERRTGFKVGMHDVEGRPCHHLAFTQEDVDWQIWIDAGKRPVPRKIVITYKTEPSQPQYSVILRKIRHVDMRPEDAFDFTPPAGYEEIEVLARGDEEDDG